MTAPFVDGHVKVFIKAIRASGYRRRGAAASDDGYDETRGIPKLLHEARGTPTAPLAAATDLIANRLPFPFAPQLPVGVAVFETFGGLTVALGLLMRLVAPMFTAEMACVVRGSGPASLDG